MCRRIYDLKKIKKNQELDKFKFVLDYKIKELCRQMEPRENKIKCMKEQIRKVHTFTQDWRSSLSIASLPVLPTVL